MNRKPKLSDTELVTQHLKKLDPGTANIIEMIRQIILATDPNIVEHIKWNNPAFYYTGEMKPFDPKEYKRDLIVMNLYKGRIMLVFPSGAKVKDNTGFLEGNYADGRRTATFTDAGDVQAKKSILQQVIREWLKMVDD